MSLLRRLPKNDSGQALLVVLLSMTVILTIVLSVVSRTVTDITITTYEEDAQRAFDAAEAGIEDALLTGAATGVDTDIGEATYNVSFVYPVPDNKEYWYPADLISGESATFWFVEHDTSGNLTCSGNCARPNNLEVCWGTPLTPNNQPSTPAVELSFYYDTSQSGVSSGDFSDLKIARVATDPNSSRTPTNNFTDATTTTCTIAGQNFAFSSGTIALGPGASGLNLPCLGSDGCVLMLKVRMFYNSSVVHPLAIDVVTTGGTNLPPQGTEIDSIGAAGDSTRRINVFQSYPEPPFVFDSAIFGQGDLTK